MSFYQKILAICLLLYIQLLKPTESLSDKCALIDTSGTAEVSFIRLKPWEFVAVEGIHANAALTAIYTNSSITESGWSLLEIHGNQATPDDEMAYLAGYAEGCLLRDRIHMEFHNYLDIDGSGYCANNESDYCKALDEFIEENKSFMSEQIKENPFSNYWHLVSMFLNQLRGLEEGYNSVPNIPKMQKNGFFFLQIAADLDDLESAWDASVEERKSPTDPDMRSKCSALIKVLPGNSELYATQDTWDTYYAMLRVFKLYDLPYKMNTQPTKIVPGRKISFSSYPGKLQSEDDFYMISSNLVSMETSNAVYDTSLYRNLKPSCVFEGIRTMTSNRLAANGREWVETFSKYNSGTYNNQWMITDFNLFKKGQELPSSDLLWVLEQLPGLIVYGDQTQILKTTSYWASYNVPYYSTIFDASGSKAKVLKYGSWYTHWGSPRAQMFKRDNDKVKDDDSLVKLMRYNDYTNDPLSYQYGNPPFSAENAISSRGDLNPPNGTYFIPYLGHRNHGGIDNKVASSELLEDLKVIATAGPTHDDQPVFKWSTSGFKPLPQGQPDVFDFEPVIIQWKL